MKLNDHDLDDILSLTSQAKSDLYNRLGSTGKADREKVKSARYKLDAALGSAKSGDYKQAVRQLSELRNLLEKSMLLKSEWAEIYVAQAICFAKLKDKKSMGEAWTKARDLEPNNKILKDIAQRLELI